MREENAKMRKAIALLVVTLALLGIFGYTVHCAREKAVEYTDQYLHDLDHKMGITDHGDAYYGHD
jgi:hypothetical protein